MSSFGYEACHPVIYEAEQPDSILVPPPMVEYSPSGEAVLNVPGTESYQLQDDYLGKSHFMRQLTNHGQTTPQRLLDWAYSERRTAQNILPWILLGPSAVARDQEFLRKNGVTLLLAVRSDKSAQARMISGARVAAEMGIYHRDVDVSSTQNLRAHFISAIQAINHNLEQHCNDIPTIVQNKAFQGKTMVFCESGNGRSATVVAAYMMAMFSLNVVQAVHAIQAQRFCIGLDDEQRQILSNFGDLLQAQRDVSSAYVGTVMKDNITHLEHFSRKATKRTLDEADEDNAEAEKGALSAGGQGRGGSAPFRDIMEG